MLANSAYLSIAFGMSHTRPLASPRYMNDRHHGRHLQQGASQAKTATPLACMSDGSPAKSDGGSSADSTSPSRGECDLMHYPLSGVRLIADVTGNDGMELALPDSVNAPSLISPMSAASVSSGSPSRSEGEHDDRVLAWIEVMKWSVRRSNYR